MADRHRLTIFHDDRSFRDRRERLLDDMRRQVDEDLRRFGFGRHHWGSDFGGTSALGGGGLSSSSSSAWSRSSDWKGPDPIGRLMSHDFFRLRPSSPVGGSALTSSRRDEFGSHESLDDMTVRGLYTDPAGGGPVSAGSASSSPAPTAGNRSVAAAASAGGGGGPRLFSMSFDVKEYDAEDISVTVEEQTLIVRATNRTERDGAVSVKEFNRKIKIPTDVDPEKLTSTLSSDGILTVEAPVPPVYPSSSNSAFSPYQAVQQPPHYQQQMLQNTNENGSVSSCSSPAVSTSSPSPATNQSSAAAATTTTSTPLDTPVFSWDEAAGRRKLNLVLEVGQPYMADDIVVKLDGRRLIVEATHVAKYQGRSSKTSMQRDFDLPEDIDISSIRALLQTSGQLAVTAYVV